MKKKRIRIKKFPIFVIVFLLVWPTFLYSMLTRSVFEIELKAPVLSFMDMMIDEPIETEFRATFRGSDVTAEVTKTSPKFEGRLGKYEITFSYVYDGREFRITKEIEVKDTEAPVVSLNHGKTMIVLLDSEFDEPGYKAIDNFDGDITDNVTVSGRVDTSSEGTYEIIYTVSDTSGNKTTVTRTVIVSKIHPLSMSVSDFSLDGFFTNVQLAKTGDMGSQYADSFMHVGDVTALNYLINRAIPERRLWHREGVTLNTIFTQNIRISNEDPKMTLIESVRTKVPSRILLSLGTDSIDTMDIDEFIQKYKELLTELKTINPEMVIIVQSIFPVAESVDRSSRGINNDKINKMNFHLLKLCSELNIPFLNTAVDLKNEQGTLKDGYFRTTGNGAGIHLSETGNRTAMQFFRNHGFRN